MASALVPLAPGFEDIEAVTIIDVLRRGGVEVVTASVSGSLDVEASHGLKAKADALFEDVAGRDFDAIVLPGGMPGTSNLGEFRPLIEKLSSQISSGRLVGAICAAPTILCNEGLLDKDVHVTCYPSCGVELDRPCANVPVVADGNVITGQAPGSAMLFSLVVLRHLAGDQVAGRVASGLVTDVL